MTTFFAGIGFFFTFVYTWFFVGLRLLSVSDASMVSPPRDLGSRLPQDVQPSVYVLTMNPDFKTDTFSGNVEITMDIFNPRKYIALHTGDLMIEDTRLFRIRSSRNALRENKQLLLRAVYPVTKFDMTVIEVEGKPISGTFVLQMQFSGSMANRNYGFYVSAVKDPETNTNRKLAATQFEPTHARKAFPCFDEPNFKSVFNICIVRPSDDGYNALSNMPPIGAEEGVPAAGLTTVCFEPSLPMSTYIVAFVVSDYVNLTTTIRNMRGDKLPISVYTNNFKKESSRFALQIASKATRFFMNLFNVDYSLPKIDMVAIPDFASGAMENWGLIMFREMTLLYDPASNSVADMTRVADTVCHELAHMWFGNLVTMDWWDDIWLNEGFATYMQSLAIDHIFPEWNEMVHFLVDAKFGAMSADSRSSSHPIIRISETSDEINQHFDAISYKKGASIIRMLENFMGKKFFKGITEYLKKHMFGNAVTRDLLVMLQQQVNDGVDIIEMVDTWTRQSGFPVLNVVRKENTYFLTQTRFLADMTKTNDSSTAAYKYKWDIPVSYVTNSEDQPRTLFFAKDEPIIQLQVDSNVDWVKFNHNSVGYYKVNYDMESWSVFSKLLENDLMALNEADRADLLSDAFSHADAGTLPYDVPLTLLRYIVNDVAFGPWQVVSKQLMKIQRMLYTTLVLPKFQNVVRYLVDPIYQNLGWNMKSKESFQRTQLRSIILNLACTMGHEDCLSEAGERFSEFLEGEPVSRPHPDIRKLVYMHGMSTVGREEHWNRMFDLYLEENDPQEKDKLLMGLTCVRDAGILSRFLKMAEDEKIVRRQNYFSVLSAISLNPIGKPIVWDYLRSNWKALARRFTLNDRAFGRIIGPPTSSFSTPFELAEVKEFFARHPDAGAGADSRQQALEIIENNVRWLKKNFKAINEWLENYN